MAAPGAAEDIFDSSVPLDIVHLHSRPLINLNKGKEQKEIDLLDVQLEQVDLLEALHNTGKSVKFISQIATVKSFESIFARGCRVLHFSGHGTEQFLALEGTHCGELVRADSECSQNLIKVHGSHIKLVVLCACHSEHFGVVFQQSNVPHVICIDSRQRVSDFSSKEFSRTLYKNLLDGKTVRTAFEAARELVRTDGLAGEQSKFLLLPQHNENEQDPHNVCIFRPNEFADGSPTDYSLAPDTDRLPHSDRVCLPRQCEMFSLLNMLFDTNYRLCSIYGAPGSGKTRLLIETAHYMAERKHLIHKSNQYIDHFVWIPFHEDSPRIVGTLKFTVYAGVHTVHDQQQKQNMLVSYIAHCLGWEEKVGSLPQLLSRLAQRVQGRLPRFLLMFDSIDTDGISQSLTPVLKELVHQAVNVKIATTSKSEFLLQMGNIPSNPFAMPALNASQMKSLVHRLLKQARPFVTLEDHDFIEGGALFEAFQGNPTRIYLAIQSWLSFPFAEKVENEARLRPCCIHVMCEALEKFDRQNAELAASVATPPPVPSTLFPPQLSLLKSHSSQLSQSSLLSSSSSQSSACMGPSFDLHTLAHLRQEHGIVDAALLWSRVAGSAHATSAPFDRVAECIQQIYSSVAQCADCRPIAVQSVDSYAPVAVEALNEPGAFVQSRALTAANFDAFRVKRLPVSANNTVVRDVFVSFVPWFVDSLRLINRNLWWWLRQLPNAACALDFVSSSVAAQKLSGCPIGTFIIRFSDSQNFTLAVAYVKDVAKIEHFQIFCQLSGDAIRYSCQLSTGQRRDYDSLSHMIAQNNALQFLYPDIPKPRLLETLH